MEIKKIIEKLYQDEKSEGTGKVLKSSVNSYIKDPIERIDEYNFISGFLWGLLAANYISKDQRLKTIDELFNIRIDNQKGESL